VPNDPTATRGVTIFFNIRQSYDGVDYYGYIWWDSKVRVGSDFLGHRFLEVEKGKSGAPTVFNDAKTGELLVMNRRLAWGKFKELYKESRALPENAGLPEEAITNIATSNLMALIKSQPGVYYTNAFRARYNQPVDLKAGNYFWIPPIDEPGLSDRLDAVVATVERALPGILSLTNQIAAVLTSAHTAVEQVNATLAATHPTLTNLAVITGNLRDPKGSLGDWLLPTNVASQLEVTLRDAHETLQSVHTTVDSADTNVTLLATDLDHTLVHLSDLTSNLAWQVQINTNLVGEISTTITHADDLIEGLKREWFLRSAFKKKPAQAAGTAPAAKP
jgi:hypothetical protein